MTTPEKVRIVRCMSPPFKGDRVAREMAASKKMEAEQIEKRLHSLVESGGIRIRVDGKVVDTPDYACPHCGTKLPRLDILNYYAETYGRNGMDYTEGIVGLVRSGRGFHEVPQKCQCGKNVPLTFQLVI